MPEVVVVHGGEVVVGHGVDHLLPAGGRDGEAIGAAHQLACGEAEHGTDPLVAGEEGVAHGAVELEGHWEWDGQVEGAAH